MSKKKAGFTETQTWTIYGSGQIKLSEIVDPAGKLKTDEWIAAKVTGIGNGSCGPLTDEQYRTKDARTEYPFFIVPFANERIPMN